MNIGTFLQDSGQKMVTCGPEESARDAAGRLRENGIGAMPVLGSDGKLVGMLSERDLAYNLSVHGARLSDLKVKDLLAKRVLFMGPGATMHDALMVMHAHGFRHLPVLADGEVIGIVSIRDVLTHVADLSGFTEAGEVLSVA